MRSVTTPLSSAAPHTLSSAERAQLAQSVLRPLHTARNSTKAHVSLVEWPPDSGRQVVIKDGRNLVWWFRLFIWRHQLYREWKALRYLSGTGGTPEPLFRVGADAIAMELCPGESLLRYTPEDMPPSVIESLARLMILFHEERGVTHCDLHRDNVLYDEATGRVTVIDWATSCSFGTPRHGWKAWAWHEWEALDIRAIAKIKMRYAPQLMTDRERDVLENGGTLIAGMVRRVGAFFKRRKRTPKS